MSEEEKKVIEELKEEVNKSLKDSETELDTFILVNIENARIILNTIEEEKQKNFKRSDMIFCLNSENKMLKDRIKALENADLTTIYMDGFYDGEKKWKEKIHSKIEEIGGMEEIADLEREVYNRIDYAIEILLELLEE